MNFKKIDQADLDFPRRELSNGGLGIIATLLVPQQIIFCVRLADRQSSCSLDRSGFSSLRVFHRWSRNCRSLSGLLAS